MQKKCKGKLMARKVCIIAEAGVNHNGDLEMAKKLVDKAAYAGADFIKFQIFTADRLVIQKAQKAEYQKKSMSSQASQYEMLQALELSVESYKELIEYSKLRNIGIFSTGFDEECIDLLTNLGQECYKIPSGEITNLHYLRHIGRLGKPIILSTGMATLGEIEAAIDVIEKAGTSRSDLTVLHCTTAYPTPMTEVNLRAMQSINAAFGVAVGYSDHTVGIEVPIAAVALGATVIEKHLTLDRSLPGPDHQASLEPSELKLMISAIRNIEVALGDGVKRLTRSEIENIQAARKSLFASKRINCGDKFSINNIVAKRPATGISPMRLDEIVGRVANRDFLVDEQIEL